MATYTAYESVKKLQVFLEEERRKGVVTGATLKEPDGSFDGKYGPATSAAFWEWMVSSGGSNLSGLVAAGVLTEAEAVEITKAQEEYEAKRTATNGRNGGGAVTQPSPKPAVPLTEEGWPAWKWLLLGAGVAATGLVVYSLVKQGREEGGSAAPAKATAGMGCMCGAKRRG